ncbi:MAG: SAM-dependent methyltransferase [Clostridiales bacterium]|nr:SAM-dependent methyltransferase [Clostridiales bacterium]
MGYGKRIDTLCSLLKKAETFADVGCDHGYCSEYMLKNGLCDRAILSDISKGSLAKAEALLAPYIRQGKAISVLGDGFLGVPKDVDEVLIAGMGGSEIVSILSDEKYGFMPKRFVFQPMHDAEKLRRYILANGGYIDRDFTFEDGKFYDVICGGRCECRGQVCDEGSYTDAEYEFGKENLETFPEAFTKRMNKLIGNIDKYLKQPQLQEASKADLLQRKNRLQGVLNGEIK